MAVAGAALAATSVESANVVGYDKSLTGGAANTFAGAPFLAVGYNTVDIQSIQIPGAEWDGITFTIWEGIPSVRENSEFTYYDASNDPNGEATVAYWGDEEANPATYSIESGQGIVLGGAEGYNIQFAGQVPDADVALTGGEANTFCGNPFPSAIDIQSIQIPGAEWDGVTFTVWEGIPTVRAGSEFTYYDASNDPNGEATVAYWGDEEANPVTYSINPGEGFVLGGAEGYEITISKPYSL
ncbi:MAG: hypothetical protein IKH04_06325 [Kiritimatiellae bacterium]|nr:hypothetical protein [Kiritimatiellia bacterium]